MVEYTINTLLKKGIENLGEGDYLNPLLDSQILLGFVLDVERMYLYTHKDDIVDNKDMERFLELIEKRKKRYPLQYIIGKQEFMGLDFFVKEGVLVPRADTEILVESIIDIVKNGYFKDKENLNIVDIGTGSGAITLSLAHYIKNSFVYSVDISDIPIEVATKNSINLSLNNRVKFLKGNLLEPLQKEELKNRVDILVSNPPYIPSNVIDDLQTEVSDYEPRLALDGGEDGLDFYRDIIKSSDIYLSSKGMIAFEIGYDQGEAVKNLLKKNGKFEDIKIIKDLSGLDRVVLGFHDEQS
ncbi:protein methyltransferase HemK [Gottschalkia acidurici 9a]|uniref:Release factor glutamine methyltransferase n=1 Tax=Gottschalkia acidurici (strain ATCC 7906 / DSM 604 / BCRC 14475 / CIP 104303 / KCTC 5404 / NCIMB 10678 / 9a) TaxID=1128398 RepID=K0AVF5_GOTA9|nr:peptide chain release factor N(5)-glutamine methyltransferase [Gottschalkia acidurici]AFS77264.1 protein methyltransferase HemK [Gottschalkia acidurici 9a]